MLAVQEPKKIYIKEPSGTLEQRQIARMIKHLRDQYQDHHPTESMPSDWLLEQLIINGAKPCVLAQTNWLSSVRSTLQEIIIDTSYADCQYINNDNFMPLFPNSELYETWEVHNAMKKLLKYMDE